MKIEELITLDAEPSMRSYDDNGYMHVQASHITKAQVVPYWGREVPGWEARGLEPSRLYYAYRSPEELEKSVNTWNGLPIHLEHHVDSADNPQKLTRVGTAGTSAKWANPYVDNALIIWDADAQERIKDGSYRELSCAYRYEPDFTPGTADGIPYDFIMRNIKGNHIALVEKGRAGRDVVVADSAAEISKGGEEMEEVKEQGMTPVNVGQLIDKLTAIKSKLEADEKEALDELLTQVNNKQTQPDEQPAAEGKAQAEPEDEEQPKAEDEGEQAAEGEQVVDLTKGEAQDEDEEEEPTEEDKMDAFVEALTPEQAKKLAEKLAEKAQPQPKKEEPAMDADSIRAALVRDFKERSAAARAVRKVCGELDPMTFDSAADIYGEALKTVGIACDKYPATAWAGMFDAYQAAQGAAQKATRRTADAGELEGAFAGLKKIIIGG